MNVTPQSSWLRPEDFLDRSGEAPFPSRDKCTQAASGWVRNGALFDLLRDCVRSGDVATLSRLHEDSLPIHEILGYAPAEPFDSSALPFPFRAGEGQLVTALRAWSGVAIAAVTSDGV